MNLIRILEVSITYYAVAHIFSGVWISLAINSHDVRLTWMNRIPVP